MPRATRSTKPMGTALVTELKPTTTLQLSSPPATPIPAKRQRRSGPSKATEKFVYEGHQVTSDPATPPNRSRKRNRPTVKIEEGLEALPHNLGKPTSAIDLADDAADVKPMKRRRVKKENVEDGEALLKKTAPDLTAGISSSRKPKKSKDTSYGLTPGQTPFPDWPHPTPEECREVNDTLEKTHGAVKAPKEIPKPSLNVSGCGEVPSVLDALIRTRLSAATTNANSSRAFQGLVERFGILKEGIGKGSVDWDAVRRADVKDVFEAIKSGGLAQVKSKDIKEILQLVYEENQGRREAILNPKDDPAGGDSESKSDKEREIAQVESSVISLDHLHLLSDKEAFDKLVKYPGIGPKTASCVLLFCLQRPSFAVDTHVFRLCTWLGWVPPNATRNTAYAHCDVRIPDELKYALHYLLIKHGKTCPRCRANTSEGYKAWEDGCPIDHLVTRSGVRKGGAEGSPTKKKAFKKGRKEVESEEESDLSELSDMGSDGEE